MIIKEVSKVVEKYLSKEYGCFGMQAKKNMLDMGYTESDYNSIVKFAGKIRKGEKIEDLIQSLFIDNFFMNENSEFNMEEIIENKNFVSKLHKYDLSGSPAYIRKCYGFVLEVSHGNNEYIAISKLLEKFGESKIWNIYGLRHSENDWSRPYSVTPDQNILVNRLGWFITRDKMKIKHEIQLNMKNQFYYVFDDNYEIISFGSYTDEMNILSYFKNEDTIISNMKKYNE